MNGFLRSSKALRHLIVVTMMSSTIIFQSMEIAAQRKQLIKPLVILHDANGPSLSATGDRVAFGPEVEVHKIYDVATGQLLRRVDSVGADVAVLSSDGRRVGSFGSGRYIEYEVGTGKVLVDTSTAIRDESRQIDSVRVWYKGGRLTKNITGDLRRVLDLSRAAWRIEASRDSPVLVFGDLTDQSLVRQFYSRDGLVKGDAWDTPELTGSEEFVVASRHNYLQRARNSVTMWNVRNGEIVFSVHFSSRWFTVSDDGTRLCAQKTDPYEVQCWDPTTGRKLFALPNKLNRRDIDAYTGALSPDGKILVTASDHDILLWDASTGQLLSRHGHQHGEAIAKALVFSADGRRLAIGTDNEVVSVWALSDLLKGG